MATKETHLNKFQIISSTESIAGEILRVCSQVPDAFIFRRQVKWSVAENLDHLRRCFEQSRKELQTPKLLLRWRYGHPGRESKNYNEVENSYRQQLEAGHAAAPACQPSFGNQLPGREQLVASFRSSLTHYLNQLRFNWEDDKIDNYQLPHPLLGKITVREWMYYHIVHCWLHFDTIRRLKEQAY